ncbi:hypothetical protein CCC_01843 [Paramagnetospirillum magnetotacticum MS-1]|uniref:Uncharacterized protein n=1 Tax=Paramagnetospirillum magnetotacticum MS-1 TaxID=272627 RepID=A0A0C2V5T6_PARME|nr:hypothetical protein CCC_01843 [Paramagnetospirillum magnetotacticum MS-1]
MESFSACQAPPIGQETGGTFHCKIMLGIRLPGKPNGNRAGSC